MSKIPVGNLPGLATEAVVRVLFAQHGSVAAVASLEAQDAGDDPDTRRARRCGFVDMPRGHAPCAGQTLNGHDVEADRPPRNDDPRRY